MAGGRGKAKLPSGGPGTFPELATAPGQDAETLRTVLSSSKHAGHSFAWKEGEMTVMMYIARCPPGATSGPNARPKGFIDLLGETLLGLIPFPRTGD